LSRAALPGKGVEEALGSIDGPGVSPLRGSR
jgi:hypothetical protein